MREDEKTKENGGSVSATSTKKKRTIIGIDPDSEKSGFSVLCPELKLYGNIGSLSFPALMKELQKWKQAAEYEDAELHVYIEGGWLNRSNWHLTTGMYTSLAKAAEIGRCTGRNHQTGILIGEMCEALGIAHTIIKPLKKMWKSKDGKITAQEFKSVTGYTGRTNQDSRDAALIAWVCAGLPIRISLQKIKEYGKS